MSERKLRIGFPSNQIVLILMGILVLYLAVDFGRQVIISQQQQGKLHQVQAQIDGSKQRQEELRKELEYSQSDAAAEAWAREQGWVKANEVPVVIVAPKTVTDTTSDAGDAGSRSNTVLDAWWELFFGSQ